MLTIRRYTSSDHAGCIALFRSNMPLYFDPVEEQFFEQWLNGLDENRLAYNNTEEEHYFVVEGNGALLACGGYYVSSTQRQARMCWGMVDQAHHRGGIGTEFLSYRINAIRQQHPDCSIGLDTSQHTFRFFEKMQFRLLSITKDHYAPGMDKYEMVFIPANEASGAQV